MTADNNNQRYEDILNNIAKRRPFDRRQRPEKPQTPHDRVLDLINAYDALAELTQRDFARVLCYGPLILRSSAWSAVVIWYQRKGYHGYQKLQLRGVWAHYREDQLMLSIGGRLLPYRAPVYDAGVYRIAIQNNFRIYYDDDGGPPDQDDHPHYRAPFQTKERLTLRQTLGKILNDWQREMEAG